MVELVIPDCLLDDTYPVLNPSNCFSSDHADLSELSVSIEEKALSSDLFSCLIGGEGTYIRKGPDGKYIIACICRDSSRSFLDKLLPACDNFVTLRKYAEGHLEFKNGRIIHAFCGALKSFLRDYVQSIADLSATPGLSLAMILLNLQQPIEMLQTAATIVNEAEQLKGTQITSALSSSLSSLRGSQHLRELLTFLFRSSIAPVLSFIERWIFLGEVDDPHNEFFIRKNKKTTREDMINDNFWDDRFSIIEDFVPKYIPSAVVDRIFSAGKAQSVLRGFEKEKGRITRHLTYDDLMVEKTITQVCQDASNALIAVFKKDHDLIACFEALRKVFLCQRGDWLCLFMRSADFILRRPRDQIMPQDFEPHIAAIIADEYVKFIGVTIEEEQLAFALQSIYAAGSVVSNTRALRKSRVTSSKTLWEYFTFVPIVREPLNLILTQAAQKKYQFLFRHLLLWRRLEQKFCHDWKLRNTLREISVQRHSMHVFITAYLNYMSVNVIHPAWALFEQRLNEIHDLEHLCMAHEQLLQAIIKGCFLLKDKIYRKISYIAMLCWHFAKELKKWNLSVSNPVTQSQGKRELAEPVMRNYPKFLNGVAQLIRELRVQSEKDADPCYSDFILSLTINSAFEREIE